MGMKGQNVWRAMEGAGRHRAEAFRCAWAMHGHMGAWVHDGMGTGGLHGLTSLHTLFISIAELSH